MKKLCVLFFLLFSTVLSHAVQAQGCSDAGFCTVPAFKPLPSDSMETPNANTLKFGISNGKADNDILIWSGYLEYSRRLSEKWRTDVKLAFLSQCGKNVKATGLSDVYATANYAFAKNAGFTIGAKIPLTNGNNSEAGLPLPMDYQSSLGTVDVIAGLGYEIGKFKLAAAVQQPLTQNKNRFIAENYPESSEFRRFQSTNKYKRSGDVLLRVSYQLKLRENLMLTPGLLPVYHFQNDQFTNSAGQEEMIEGSRGLTLNGTLYLDYKLNRNNGLNLNFGAPFITRKVRPDGLTRSYVASMEYRVGF